MDGAMPVNHVQRDGTLRITGARLSDSGRYICVARNYGETSESVVNLSVTSKWRGGGNPVVRGARPNC